MQHEIEELDLKGLRKFGITTGIIVGVLFGLIFPYLFGNAFPLWPWVIAIVLSFFGVAFPGSLRPVYKIWMKIGLVLGWINTRIILGIIFFIVFVPMALCLKILRKDAMARNIHTPLKSYRIKSGKRKYNHFERPY